MSAEARQEDGGDSCDRCGRRRPHNNREMDRFIAVFEDHSASSAAYVRLRLCGQCWSKTKDFASRRGAA